MKTVQEVLDDCWEASMREPEPRWADSWFHVTRRRLVLAAAPTPLRMFFPYTSHNSLHFSRCSHYPFTHDCPWIWFDDKSRFITYGPTLSGEQGNLVDSHPLILCDANDPSEAVAAAVGALAAHTAIRWIGNAETPESARIYTQANPSELGR